MPDDCDIASGTSADENSNGIPDECEPVFERGDANGNGGIEFTDAIFVLQFLTGAGGMAPTCLDATDVNDDELLNLADAVFLLRFLFVNDVSPPAPFGGCGIDGDGVSIGCEGADSCP